MDSTTEPFKGRELEYALNHDRERDFVGQLVNLGGKDGDLWEETTIIGAERKLGWLLHLSGGNYVPNVYADPPERRPITDVRYNRVYAHDVARGLIHRPALQPLPVDRKSVV